MFGDGWSRCETRRVDSDEVDEAGKALVPLLRHDEVAKSVTRTLELGADAGDVGLELLVPDTGKEATHRLPEGGPPLGIDGEADPPVGEILDVRPEPQPAVQAQHGVGAEARGPR